MGEIELLPPSLYNVEEESLVSKQHCAVREREGKIYFHGTRQKIAFLGLVQIYFVPDLGQNVSNKFSFLSEIFQDLPGVPIKTQHFLQGLKQWPFVVMQKYFQILKGYE